MSDLTTAMATVAAAVATVGVPVRTVADVTTVGHGPAVVLRPPSAVEQHTSRLWNVEVPLVVIGTSQLDIGGLVALTQNVLNALGDAGLRSTCEAGIIPTDTDRLTVYQITVEV